ncbi:MULTISPECIES: hypothetical protein [unclassified Aminobacter]|uniref:hypothetical protein n=1 Tax=unclassified Aminobacter TaxID=2644704 RepID=UPI0004637D45|nr:MULTISPECIES: hypothetical protein [unclassified Aminobacter]
MTSQDDQKRKQASQKDERRKRLAEQLRANLMRRKAQARSRRVGEADSRPDGLLQENEGAERSNG